MLRFTRSPLPSRILGSNNGIGSSGKYDGQVTPDPWHRIAFTVDQADGVNQIERL